MEYEPPLPDGQHYIYLKCQHCGVKKRILMWMAPMGVGSLLPEEGWGRDAHCIKCGKATLEILNTRPDPPLPPPPKGFTRDPG